MIPFSLKELSAQDTEFFPDKDLGKRLIENICTDSRKTVEGCLYIPLKGERYDGHDFIEAAIEKRAAYIACEKKSPLHQGLIERFQREGFTLISVNSTLELLMRAAKTVKGLSGALTVGITGSCGKTSTKNDLAEIMKCSGKTVAAPESYNNEIGVSKTLLMLEKDTKYCVLEMGSRGFGHIKKLTDFAKPDISVITNIGRSHLEFLKTVSGVERAKEEIVNALDPKDTAVLNADDDRCMNIAKRHRGRIAIATYGFKKSADYRCDRMNFISDVEMELTIKHPGGVIDSLRVSRAGLHSAYNAIAAIAASMSAGISEGSVRRGLMKTAATKWRMEIIEKGQVKIINDSYNANPDSMRVAICELCRVASKSRAIAVLGDMAELGSESDSAHVEIGRYLVEQGVDILITVGRKAKNMAKGARISGLPKGSVFASSSIREAAEVLDAIVEDGDVILIKGSRIMGLEKLVELVA